MATAPARTALTDQQGVAVSRRQASVVLSSGAGCGKTHVLTQRYLSHLRDDGAEVGQVVAITFTDRAARQMRERIRRACRDHLRAAATDEEAERWAGHLRGLETAPISTIHAFCGNLLRQHAVEAGLDPRFEVLEDYLAGNLQTQALTACLQRLLTFEGEAGEDLRRLVLLYGWRPTVEAVQHLMGQWDEAGWARWLGCSDEEIAAAWLGPARAELLPRHLEYLTTASPKIARCFWLLRSTPCTGPKMAANVRRVLEQTPLLAGAADLGAAVAELKDAAKVVGTEKAKAWPSEEIYEAVKGAFEDFRKELPAQLQLFTEAVPDADAAVAAGRCFLRVADEAVRAYRQLKRRNGVADFQDLLVQARDLLRDHSEVRERLQRRYRFLLIDELQDTDPVQMELVEHLCGTELTDGKLFAVGDHKQSIYRFRGADVGLFQDLKQRVPNEGRLGLTVNFRSQPAILDFTNALLGPRPGFPSGLEDYEPLEPFHAQVNPGPCIEFLWAPREEREHVTEARLREADWIARRIAGMVAGGECLVVERSADGARLRPVRPGDVVLLFRAMSNVELYEAALRRYGLNYYLVGGRAFFAQQEIYDLLNLLRALENPQDVVSLAGTLRSPFCCLSDEALFVLTQHSGGLWGGLHDDEVLRRLAGVQRWRAERAARNLDRWRGRKDRLPIARLLGEVFADTGFDAATQFEFLGDRKLANLWKLVDLARSFDRSGLFGMAEFIGRLGDLVRSQPREEQAATQPENADVVRLMTIHQAKGLEFPVVVVPDVSAAGGGARLPAAHWDERLGCVPRPPADDPPPLPDLGWRLWSASEEIAGWHEDLRILYVACTRAQDYLILSAALPADYSPGNSWMLQLAERFDLGRGDCLDPDRVAQRRPQVRVTNHLAPPLAVAVPASLPPETNGQADDYLGALEHFRSLGDFGSLTGIVTVGEVAGELRPVVAAGAVVPFDAEDGSDRSAWFGPRELLGLADDSPGEWRDRVIRRVLGEWDWNDPAGWRTVLTRTLDSEPGLTDRESFRAELERPLDCLARSELVQRLASARSCRRDVEFRLNYPPEDASAPVGVRGVIDCLWQDQEGGWHVLAYTTESVPPSGREKDWQKRKATLVLWAVAVQRTFGQWPRTINRYYFEEGVLVSRAGGRLPHRQVLAALFKDLIARAADCLPGGHSLSWEESSRPPGSFPP
jgi:ATP-dependent helicase/nuclease subunit A